MKHETKGHAYAAIGRVVRHTTTGDLAEVTGFYGDTHRFIRSIGTRTPHVVPLDEIEAAYILGDRVRTVPGNYDHPRCGVVDAIKSNGWVGVRDSTGEVFLTPMRWVELDSNRTRSEGSDALCWRAYMDIKPIRNVSREAKKSESESRRSGLTVFGILAMSCVALIMRRDRR